MHCSVLINLFGILIFGNSLVESISTHLNQLEKISQYLINLDHREIKAVNGHTYKITDLLFIRDGEIIASAYEKGGSGVVTFWSTYSGVKLPMTLISSHSPIMFMIADRAGHMLFTLDDEGVIRKWNIASLNGYKPRNKDEFVQIINQSQSTECIKLEEKIIGFEFDSQSNQFLVASTHTVRLFDKSFMNNTLLFQDDQGRISSFSKNEFNNQLAIGVANRITVFNKEKSQWKTEFNNYHKFGNTITASSFLQQYLIVGDNDGWLYSLDLKKNKQTKDPRKLSTIHSIKTSEKLEIDYFAYLDNSGITALRHYSPLHANAKKQLTSDSLLKKPAIFVKQIAIGREGRFLATGSSDGQLNLYSGRSASLVTSMLLFSEDDWITFSIEQKSYFGSKAGMKYTFIAESSAQNMSKHKFVNIQNTNRVNYNQNAIMESLQQAGDFLRRDAPENSIYFE